MPESLATAAAWAEIDRKIKPRGSLGILEEVAVRLSVVQGTISPVLDRGRIVVFAADHGVTVEGVSAYPAEVTAQMVANLAAGGAAVTVLARAAGIEVEVVDVGVDSDLTGIDGVVQAKVRRGSRNLAREPAMRAAELDRALEVGAAAVRRAAAAGAQVVGLGEMGIGNTTAASALLSALTGAPPEQTTGRGTGIDDGVLARKIEVIGQALSRNTATGPREALASLGGLEIAAMAGAVLECSRVGVPAVIDGFISSVAALAAVRIDPAARGIVFTSHRSAEAGHEIVLRALDMRPLLDLGMRLGEGTGAALAIPVLRAAAAVMREMATFESAGVSGPA